MVLLRDLKVLKSKRSWRQGNRRRWWKSRNNLAKNLWLCVFQWWRGPSVFRCFQVDEQPLTIDTKRSEPAYAAGCWASFVMGKQKDSIPSAKSGLEMAEGEDESTWSIQSSFVSRWWQIKALWSGICTCTGWGKGRGKTAQVASLITWVKASRRFVENPMRWCKRPRKILFICCHDVEH